jgi:hypothetical protein
LLPRILLPLPAWVCVRVRARVPTLNPLVQTALALEFTFSKWARSFGPASANLRLEEQHSLVGPRGKKHLSLGLIRLCRCGTNPEPRATGSSLSTNSWGLIQITSFL